MPTYGKEIPFPKRVAILTLHWHGNKTWVEISSLLKVSPDTARQICIWAKERASDPSDFDDVLMHLESLGKSRRRESETSWEGGGDWKLDASGFVDGIVGGIGGIEGVTAMRDMDWR